MGSGNSHFKCFEIKGFENKESRVDSYNAYWLSWNFWFTIKIKNIQTFVWNGKKLKKFVFYKTLRGLTCFVNWTYYTYV
jgi:hypothetical protein